ncbi:hypothetical protein FGK63_14885 [Ruegeria sediminis]|uniref:Uncharacterized protein n=1 Tax=Ruegeria sediminis TaxID=2583820 RepID=A0ABY2WV03_9RHOB|nr:hypothetical protein [Ruegeria sediminis]TMV06428.1 hypothetical protein FGK63_14885 [Ruegeria sediminis]
MSENKELNALGRIERLRGLREIHLAGGDGWVLKEDQAEFLAMVGYPLTENAVGQLVVERHIINQRSASMMSQLVDAAEAKINKLAASPNMRKRKEILAKAREAKAEKGAA